MLFIFRSFSIIFCLFIGSHFKKDNQGMKTIVKRFFYFQTVLWPWHDPLSRKKFASYYACTLMHTKDSILKNEGFL